jgi:hypothetical protein
MRCDECKYMSTDAREYGPIKLYRCKAVPMPYDASEWSDETGERVIISKFEDTLAFVQDASDYAASLLVRPEFYCAMFKAK